MSEVSADLGVQLRPNLRRLGRRRQDDVAAERGPDRIHPSLTEARPMAAREHLAVRREAYDQRVTIHERLEIGKRRPAGRSALRVEVAHDVSVDEQGASGDVGGLHASAKAERKAARSSSVRSGSPSSLRSTGHTTAGSAVCSATLRSS